MYKIKNIQKRVKLENIIGFLLQGVDSQMEPAEDLDKKIEESYERIFAKLEEKYPDAAHDNVLCNDISAFALTHDDIFFEAGFLAGIRLYKEIEQACHLPSIHDDKRAGGTETVLELFAKSRMSTALEETLQKDGKYQQVCKELQQKTDNENFQTGDISGFEDTDDIISLYNKSASEYGRAAYIQGMKDTFDLFSMLRGE